MNETYYKMNPLLHVALVLLKIMIYNILSSPFFLSKGKKVTKNRYHLWKKFFFYTQSINNLLYKEKMKVDTVFPWK